MKEINKFSWKEGNSYVHMELSNFFDDDGKGSFSAYPYRHEFDDSFTFYQTSEHYYQAAKATTAEDRLKILGAPTAGQAKKLGRAIKCRDDWDEIKITVMRSALWHKFRAGTAMAEFLLSTGDAYLVEGNTWKDTFWGVCNGKGFNWLGWLLMAQRDYLRCATTRQGRLL